MQDMFYNLIQIETFEMQRMLSFLKNDSNFLQKHNIVNYSLMLVIERQDSYDEERFTMKQLPNKREMDSIIARRTDIYSGDRELNRRNYSGVSKLENTNIYS